MVVRWEGGEDRGGSCEEETGLGRGGDGRRKGHRGQAWQGEADWKMEGQRREKRVGWNGNGKMYLRRPSWRQYLKNISEIV